MASLLDQVASSRSQVFPQGALKADVLAVPQIASHSEEEAQAVEEAEAEAEVAAETEEVETDEAEGTEDLSEAVAPEGAGLPGSKKPFLAACLSLQVVSTRRSW